MEILKIKEEYPCGFKREQMVVKFNIINLIIPTGYFKNDACPLHGKDCPPKHTHKTTKR